MTKEEQKWLDDNKSYIDRDSRERDSREYIEGEVGAASFSARADTHSLADVETISDLDNDDLTGYLIFIENANYLSIFEKELLKFRFIEGMSLRQIEKIVELKTMVKGEEVLSTNMSGMNISRILNNAAQKIKNVTNVTSSLLIESNDLPR